MEESTMKSNDDIAVLVVDDENIVLRVVSRLAQKATESMPGFYVLTAASAEEALDVVAGKEVGLVVSDYQMPGMKGPEFLEKVRSSYPSASRLLMSGTDLPPGDGLVHRFFRKPFDNSELMGAIREGVLAYTNRQAAAYAQSSVQDVIRLDCLKRADEPKYSGLCVKLRD